MKYSNDAVCEVQNSQTGIYQQNSFEFELPTAIFNYSWHGMQNKVLGTLYLQISYILLWSIDRKTKAKNLQTNRYF